MRVVYYTPTCFLDEIFSRVRALSQLVELHLLLQISPESWESGLFDVPPQELPSGIVSADKVLCGCFPPGVRACWKDLASFNLVVHNCPRSIHPSAWRVSWHAARFIKALHPDVVHLDDVSLRLAPLLGWIGGGAVVLNIHDVQPHSGEGSWKTALGRWLTFRHVQHFVLHNRFSRDDFSERYGIPKSKISSVPLGVYNVFREWIGKPVAEDEKMILFFGRMEPYKGIEMLLKAAPLVSSKVPDVRFVIAGRPIRGYEIPDLSELSNGGSLELLTDYINNAQAAELFQRATAVVLPYTDATQSGVVLTAYAFDKPVVATNVGGLPEYVSHEETGLLVPPRDPTKLADAIVRILEDTNLRAYMKDRIKEWAETVLSWEEIARQTLQVYEQAIQLREH